MVIDVSGHEGYWGFECQDLVCIMVRETAPVFFLVYIPRASGTPGQT